MNILVDIRSLLDKPHTGVAQYTLNFLNEALSRDKENNYFLFYNSSRFRNKDLIIFNYPNVRIVDFHWSNKLFNFCLTFLKWPKIDKLVEKKVKQKMNEVFLPNFNFVSFSKNKSLTLVAHDLSFEIYPEFFTFKQRLWHKLIRPQKICQQATKIIVHSENTKNDLVRFYKISADKIEIKTPPISKIFDGVINEPEKVRVKNKYKLSDNFVLYLGNLEPRKNLDILIRAFVSVLDSTACLLNFKLVIVGQGREQSKLRKLVHNFGISDNVKFLGYIPEEDKKALYYLAKGFVYPSFYEGYGYPVVEALACGSPVITSQTSSLTEIQDSRITFINPYNINDLAEAIKIFI
jgi:glycosyltransferase involved in cell wall biosynthesis